MGIFFKWKRPSSNALVENREILLDLNRKIYLNFYHLFLILNNIEIINSRVATAASYIFFCALVEEKLYTMRKRRCGLKIYKRYILKK